MEKFAAQVYRTQRSKFSEKEVLEKFNKAIDNEQQHVNELGLRIKELKSSPPIWFGLLFQVAGAVAAIIIRSLGRLMIFKSGVWIEKRAIKDYNLFLKKIKFDIETITLIRKIIIDEERHVSTWQNSIEILKD